MIDLWNNVHDHVQHSIDLLREHEPPEGYYLAFSGGKDSIVCYHLCKMAGVKFDAHYMRAMEPPEVVYFIRQHYPDVQRHLPKKTIWQLIRENGIPPLRTIRYCCRILKEVGGKTRTTIVGIRGEESMTRKGRGEYSITKSKIMLSPILSWSTKQVWQFIHDHTLPYPNLYDKGWTRIGCIMCPCAGPKKMRHDIVQYPKIAEAYRRACVRAYDPAVSKTWRNGDDMFKWWIAGKGFGNQQKDKLFDDVW